MGQSFTTLKLPKSVPNGYVRVVHLDIILDHLKSRVDHKHNAKVRLPISLARPGGKKPPKKLSWLLETYSIETYFSSLMTISNFVINSLSVF